VIPPGKERCVSEEPRIRLKRPERREVPIWAAALVGFGFGYLISGWFGGIVGLVLVVGVSRFI
jgi:hypothetical protein